MKDLTGNALAADVASSFTTLPIWLAVSDANRRRGQRRPGQRHVYSDTFGAQHADRDGELCNREWDPPWRSMTTWPSHRPS